VGSYVITWALEVLGIPFRKVEPVNEVDPETDNEPVMIISTGLTPFNAFITFSNCAERIICPGEIPEVLIVAIYNIMFYNKY
jgi:hypothetical protein